MDSRLEMMSASLMGQGFTEADACQVITTVGKANKVEVPLPAPKGQPKDWHQLSPAERTVAYLSPTAELLAQEQWRREVGLGDGLNVLPEDNPMGVNGLA